MWNEILPDHFGVNPLPPDAIENMQKTAGVYSKGRGPKANQEWNASTILLLLSLLLYLVSHRTYLVSFL